MIRRAQVEHFRQHGFGVTVVTPHYKRLSYSFEKGVIRVPFYYSSRVLQELERFGILEDYLDPWVGKAYRVLLKRVQQSDIVFATSGGDLGMIKLASLLKRKAGCRFVVNFHDPVDYSRVNGFRVDDRFHVSRERPVSKYLANVDLVITSSTVYLEALKRKYSALRDRIVNGYFGSYAPIRPYLREPHIEFHDAMPHDRAAIRGFEEKIRKDRDSWSMERCIEPVIRGLKALSRGESPVPSA